MTLAIEIKPISADGTFGMFMGRTYAMTKTGRRELTPYPMDEILVA